MHIDFVCVCVCMQRVRICACVWRDMVIAAPGTPCESVFLALAMSPIPIGWCGGMRVVNGKIKGANVSCPAYTLTTCPAVGLFVDAVGRDPLSKHRC